MFERIFDLDINKNRYLQWKKDFRNHCNLEQKVLFWNVQTTPPSAMQFWNARIRISSNFIARTFLPISNLMGVRFYQFLLISHTVSF